MRMDWNIFVAALESDYDQINFGLVMPYVVKALVGDSEIVAFFVPLFMALTSTVSSSMILIDLFGLELERKFKILIFFL